MLQGTPHAAEVMTRPLPSAVLHCLLGRVLLLLLLGVLQAVLGLLAGPLAAGVS